MRSFFAVYTRSRSLRKVAEHDLEGQVAHGTIDKFIHGSEPQYATRQLFRKLYLRERLKDLPTDPDPVDAASYLLHLLNRIPDEHRRGCYDALVRCLRHAHLRSGADVPPWLERLKDLYEDDTPAEPPPPPAPGPGGEPPQYSRRPRKKKG